MKKTLFFFSLILLLCGAYINAQAQEIGSVAGSYYTTDIVAYIDGMAVPSYNIGGKTAVIAEDLAPYGFFVEYNNDIRRLSVYTGPMPAEAPSFTPVKAAQSGLWAGSIYATDIVCTVNDMWVESYNIGGRTAVVLEDMSSMSEEKRMSRDSNIHEGLGMSVACMRHEWDAQNRTISLITLRPGGTVPTQYGDLPIGGGRILASAYSYAGYNLYDAAENQLSSWATGVENGETVYFPLKDLLDATGASWRLESGVLYLENLQNAAPDSVLYHAASTIGSCYNTILPLDIKVSVGQTMLDLPGGAPIFYEYRGDVLINADALNAAAQKRVVKYQYALPDGCTDEVGKVVPSHVVAYINDMAINSYITQDGACYLAVADLAKYGFTVTTQGSAVSVLSPTKAPEEPPYAAGVLPETYWLGDVPYGYYLYPIYNGIYDVTIDGKPLDDVYVWCTLTNNTPCVLATDLAKAAGYRLDTSNPMEVRIYTN